MQAAIKFANACEFDHRKTFHIAGEWTRDRREFSKCEIRIHVPAGSIAQGEYDIS